MEKDIEKILTELFDLIGIKVDFKVTKSEDVYKVEIGETESAGLLIGAHGLTLSAIQSFLAMAIKQKTGEWITLSVDIAGWSEKQNQRLAELAQQTAERARQTGEPQSLYNLNPVQRRSVHMALANETDIETVSEGEGQDRYLIVRLKK